MLPAITFVGMADKKPVLNWLTIALASEGAAPTMR
jgi:hypothetical protein